jgi:hypothetical protein
LAIPLAIFNNTGIGMGLVLSIKDSKLSGKYSIKMLACGGMVHPNNIS